MSGFRHRHIIQFHRKSAFIMAQVALSPLQHKSNTGVGRYKQMEMTEQNLMRQAFSRDWYIPLVRGLFSILFGMLALVFPGLTLATLIYLFAAYAMIDGITTIYQSLTSRDANVHWGWGLFEGVIALGAGIGAFFLPYITGITLLYLIAFYAIFTGIAQIMASIQLRKEIENEVWLGLAGFASVLFGAFIMLNPLGGALATAWLIGVYALAFGVMLVALAFRLRGIDGDLEANYYKTQTTHVTNA